MDLFLVAITGPLAGETWALGDSPLVVGRDLSCDVRVYDSLASRRHCVLVRKEYAIELDGGKARNPALVNGKPMRTATMHQGDVLAIGAEQFLIAGGKPHSSGAGERRPEDFTLSLSDLLDSYTASERTPTPGEAQLSTTEQLASAFQLARNLAKCRSRRAAVQAFTDHLRERLEPHAVWLARPRGSSKGAFYRVGGDPVPEGVKLPSTKIMRMVISQDAATCTLDRSNDTQNNGSPSSIVAPLKTGTISLGVVILQRNREMPAYTQADSQYVEVLGRFSTPLLYTAGVIDGLQQDNKRLRNRAGESTQIVGNSPAIRDLLSAIERAAQSDLNVLIRGETGTGKELAARMVHENSHRADGPFVVLNCAAIPEDLFESQLFGHRKGAFTGAHESFDGLLAQADGGTLFLDEIADLSLPNQARFLRTAELGTYRPVGATLELEADVRIVAASNKDLLSLIREKAFRDDLYHRLCGFEVTCPPLRNHVEDIPLLAEHFIKEARGPLSVPLDGVSDEILEDLSRRPWTGNVRELRTCILRALTNAAGRTLNPDDFRTSQLSLETTELEDLDLDSWERQHIIRVLQICNGNVPDAAKKLKVGRSTLYRKLADLGISH